LNLMDEASFKYGILRYVYVDLGYKRLGQGASFAQSRVANEVANPKLTWLNHKKWLRSPWTVCHNLVRMS
ncbi:MAG: hypothetical protein ACKPKO_26895, partial [Candidatus Fonsibacter sp.]